MPGFKDRENDKFKTIITKENLSDAEFVKDYLEFSFYRRKPEKDPKLYINICRIYEVYPNTIRELLDNIPRLGYYKDYFHILKHIKYSSEVQQGLVSYIDQLVLGQLTEDIANMKKKSKISTLGKFLPREKSKMNKKTNFIDRFANQMFPGTEQFAARKKYRKLKSLINKYLGTLEVKLCSQDYEKINFNKVSHYALENNLNVIASHPKAAKKYKAHLYNLLKTGSLTYFISCALSKENTHTSEEIEEIWEYNRFVMDIPGLSNILLAKSAIIIDLSKDTFSCKFEYFTIGLALLVEEFSLLEKKIFLAGHGYIDFNKENCKTVIEKADYLMKLCGPSKQIGVTKYLDIVNEHNTNLELQCKNLIFATGKKIGNIEEELEDTKITLRQYMPDIGKYYILYYNGNKIRKYCRYNHTNRGPPDKKKIRNISQITKNSSELNNFSGPFYLILVLIVIWLVIKFRLFF
jgi:hypothetical protein